MDNTPCRFATPNESSEGVDAAYHPQGHTVYARQGSDVPTIFQGLVQELARAHMGRGGTTCRSLDFVVYSVSYVLCKRSGISVEGFSFERLPENYAGIGARMPWAEASITRDMAGGISANMSRLFVAREKVQKNRDDEAK